MATHTSWFNLQSSLNPFQGQEESSRPGYRNNQNSITYLGRYPHFQPQQQSRSMLNIQAILDNYLDNSDNFMRSQERFTFQPHADIIQQRKMGQQVPSADYKLEQSSIQIVQLEARKGLKNLARLLMRTLKSKKFDSSRCLTEQIQEILMKRKNTTQSEYAKEAKNIRRRIYDALNVIIAANVLGPDFALVKSADTISFTKKCALVTGGKDMLESRIQSLQQRILEKGKLLERLQTKSNALKWWLNSRIKQSQMSNKQKILQFPKTKQQKTKKQQLQLKKSRISLPAIFILQDRETNIENMAMNTQNSVTFKISDGKFKLFSDIDSFQILKFNQQSQRMDQDYLHEIIKNVQSQNIDQNVQNER